MILLPSDEIQTPIATIVHPKMNTGKEPFKCGMESAKCGVRPNLISVIAKLPAPSRRDPLPLRHSECGVRSVHRLTATALFPILCGHLYLTIKNLLIWLGMLAIAGLKNLNPASVLKRRPKGVE